MNTESEQFADEARRPIPPKHTWEELTTNQLIDVKLQLEDVLWSFAKNPVISKTVQQGLDEITVMIASRIS